MGWQDTLRIIGYAVAPLPAAIIDHVISSDTAETAPVEESAGTADQDVEYHPDSLVCVPPSDREIRNGSRLIAQPAEEGSRRPTSLFADPPMATAARTPRREVAPEPTFGRSVVDPRLRRAIIQDHDSTFFGETMPLQSTLPSMDEFREIATWTESMVQYLCAEQSALQEENPHQLTVHSLPCVDDDLRSTIIQEHDSNIYTETTPLQSALPSMDEFQEITTWTESMVQYLCAEQSVLQGANPHQSTVHSLPCDDGLPGDSLEDASADTETE